MEISCELVIARYNFAHGFALMLLTFLSFKKQVSYKIPDVLTKIISFDQLNKSKHLLNHLWILHKVLTHLDTNTQISDGLKEFKKEWFGVQSTSKLTGVQNHYPCVTPMISRTHARATDFQFLIFQVSNVCVVTCISVLHTMTNVVLNALKTNSSDLVLEAN